MRSRSLLAALFLVALVVPGGVQAQASANSFGLGVVAGEPTGVTARFMKGGNNFQAHAAWSFSGEDALHLSGDYLRSGRIEAQEMIPFYFGIGARVRFASDFQLGVRVPLGVNHFFSDSPVELFAEVVPILDLVPDTDLDFNGAIGVRYYFRFARD